MATIYKCDKCNKIIKDTLKCVKYYSFASSGLKKKLSLPNDIYLCEKCATIFAKYYKKFSVAKVLQRVKKVTKK